MAATRLVFRVHALRRMFQRSISVADVRKAIETGETMEAYPVDTPYPSRLILGQIDGRPIHVVVAEDCGAGELIVITAYEPDPDMWDNAFRRRKPR